MIHIKQPYKSRPIRFLALIEIGGWQVKVYSISAKGAYVPDWLLEKGKAIASKHIHQAVELQEGYRVAILILHEGADGNYILLDWWFGENMIKNHVYASTSDSPDDFKYVTPSGIAYCVWELEVIHFERQAWIKTILAQAASPRMDSYLLEQLNVDI